ncbi:hypothetical protein OROMI_027536 [Orobanche minor]
MEMQHLLLFRPHSLVISHRLLSYFPFSLNSPDKCSKPTALISSQSRNCKLAKDYDPDSISCSLDTICKQTNQDTKELSYDIYNEMLCELCEEGEIDNAMALLAQMEASGCRPNSVSYSCLITGLGDVGRTLEAEAIFQEMVMAGRRPKIRLLNAMLRSCLRKGLLELCDKVLVAIDELGLERNRKTFEILIDYYVSAGRLNDTWLVIAEMKRKGYSPNSYVYSKIIEIYRDNGMWKKAMGVLGEVRRMGMALDRIIYSSIIDTFGKHGELGEALEVFAKMQEDCIKPDVKVWNSLIRWHCRYGDGGGALDLFDRMQKEGTYPDPKIFMTIISTLGEQGKWDDIRKIFVNMQEKGQQRSGSIYAVLVDIYGQYGKFQNADDSIQALKFEGVQLSPSIFCVLANAYAQQVFSESEVLMAVSGTFAGQLMNLRWNPIPNLEGLCEQTVRVLQLMEAEGMETNLIMLNVLINAFATAGRHMEALAVYHHIRESGFSPDVVTFSTLMKAFLWSKKLDQVPKIYSEMEASGCSPDRKAREMLKSALIVLEQRH